MTTVMSISPSGLSPPVYIDTRGVYGYIESVTEKGIFIVDHQACLPRQGESYPSTRTVFSLRVFTAHQSGPWITGRTPEDPLVQDSLNGCGVPQNGTPRDTIHLHRPPPPASTGYCSSTANLLQPPHAIVHPRAHVHPPPRAPPPTTVQPALSTRSYSTTPPRATVHPALHRLLFN